MATSATDLATAEGVRNVAGRLEQKISYGGGVVLYRGTLSGGTHTVGISSGQWGDYFVVDFFASYHYDNSFYFDGSMTATRLDRRDESASAPIVSGGNQRVSVARAGANQMKFTVGAGTADILVVGYSYADS